MAKTEDPRQEQEEKQEEQAQAGTELPEQRQQQVQPQQPPAQRQNQQQQVHPQAPRVLEPAPRLLVIGYMDSQVALRVGWRAGMLAISQSRFKFLRDELGMEVHDNPDDYLF